MLFSVENHRILLHFSLSIFKYIREGEWGGYRIFLEKLLYFFHIQFSPNIGEVSFVTREKRLTPGFDPVP